MRILVLPYKLIPSMYGSYESYNRICLIQRMLTGISCCSLAEIGIAFSKHLVVLEGPLELKSALLLCNFLFSFRLQILDCCSCFCFLFIPVWAFNCLEHLVRSKRQLE